MYLERTNYFARPGHADEVLATRREASRIRIRLGLPAGQIFVRHDLAQEGADVTWECPHQSLGDYQKDLAVRAASPEFEAIRKRMQTSIGHFERHVIQPDLQPGVISSITPTRLQGTPVVPQRLRFSSGDHELTGFLYLPPGEGPFPLMITNHGSTIEQGTTDQCRPGTASLLMSWGIASFLPHRHGYGESPGVPWRTEVSSGFGSERYDTELAARLDHESDDVVAALAFVSTLPAVDADHIGVMGSSFGGTVTLLAAAKAEGLRCAVEFAGAAMNWERTPGLRKLMLEAARGLKCPIFFLQADNDYSVAPTRELAAALRNTGQVFEAEVFPAFGLSHDEGHLFERAGAVIWAPRVRGFLERWL